MTPQGHKRISLLLRHKPELYLLELDPQGWYEVEALLAAFRQQGSIRPACLPMATAFTAQTMEYG
jgi:RNA:NAD 2'-phosphotransferase (TPT1/KptA family)